MSTWSGKSLTILWVSIALVLWDCIERQRLHQLDAHSMGETRPHTFKWKLWETFVFSQRRALHLIKSYTFSCNCSLIMWIVKLFFIIINCYLLYAYFFSKNMFIKYLMPWFHQWCYLQLLTYFLELFNGYLLMKFICVTWRVLINITNVILFMVSFATVHQVFAMVFYYID
jgi:hypothetical protein